MRAAQESMAKCCCCLPINIFGIRKLCVFMIVSYTFDVTLNLAVFIVYAMHGIVGSFTASIYGCLWMRILISSAVVGLSAMLLHYREQHHHLFLAAWIVLVYVLALLNSMVSVAYTCSIPGQFARRYNLGEGYDNPVAETAPDTVLYAVLSVAQYFFFLVTALITWYCWRSVFLMHLCGALKQRPLMEQLLYEGGRDSAARKRRARVISEMLGASAEGSSATSVSSSKADSLGEPPTRRRRSRRGGARENVQIFQPEAAVEDTRRSEKKKEEKPTQPEKGKETKEVEDDEPGKEEVGGRRRSELGKSPKWDEVVKRHPRAPPPPARPAAAAAPIEEAKAKKNVKPDALGKRQPRRDESFWKSDFDDFISD